MTSLPADDSWRTLIHYLCFALFPFVLPLFLISYIVSFLSFLLLSFCFLPLLRCFKCGSCLVLHSVRYLLSFPPFFSVFSSYSYSSISPPSFFFVCFASSYYNLFHFFIFVFLLDPFTCYLLIPISRELYSG